MEVVTVCKIKIDQNMDAKPVISLTVLKGSEEQMGIYQGVEEGEIVHSDYHDY